MLNRSAAKAMLVACPGARHAVEKSKGILPKTVLCTRAYGDAIVKPDGTARPVRPSRPVKHHVRSCRGLHACTIHAGCSFEHISILMPQFRHATHLARTPGLGVIPWTGATPRTNPDLSVGLKMPLRMLMRSRNQKGQPWASQDCTQLVSVIRKL